MNIFAPFLEELPPFREYWRKYFIVKQMLVVNKTTGMRVNHIAESRAKLFHPDSSMNKEGTPRMLELVIVATKRLRDELLDKKKGTYYNLSISGHIRSFKHCSKEDRILLSGAMATIDLAESALGGAGRNVEVGGMIGIHRAAVPADISKNGFLDRGMPCPLGPSLGRHATIQKSFLQNISGRGGPVNAYHSSYLNVTARFA